jgi:glutamate mutase epsilon subunit
MYRIEDMEKIAAVDEMCELVCQYSSGEIDLVGDAVETAETLDDFHAATKNYAECTKAQRGEIAGFPYIAYKKVQVRKGAPRRALSVIDFGDYRIAFDAFAPNVR